MKRPAFEEIDPTSDCGCPGCARLAPPPSPPPGTTTPHRVMIIAAAASTALCATATAPALAAPPAPSHTDASGVSSSPGPAAASGISARPGAQSAGNRPGAPAATGAAAASGAAARLGVPARLGAPGTTVASGTSVASGGSGRFGGFERVGGGGATGASGRAGAFGGPGGDEPQTPQGGKAPLHGAGGAPGKPLSPVKTPPISRAEIINRAKVWVAAQVPYSMDAYWPDGYRQDCSGFVSMAWHLPGNEWTGSLGQFADRITKEELQPGDILLFHNTVDPEKGSHVVLFGGWTDYTHTYYTAYEQTRPTTRRQATPYPYWSNASQYLPYRYKGVTDGAAGPEPDPGTTQPGTTAFPGPASFGPGADNAYVTRLGQLLVNRGGARFYTTGPGPVWTDADRRATQAFQEAQGWTGDGADGLPGPLTWALLVSGTGRDIPPAGAQGPPKPAPGTPPATPAAPPAPPFPGRASFRPGADNAHVTRLGRQLVKKGFGRFYATGPGPRWSDADRRAVEAFQLAQGWHGSAADGYPGPETWRRLFR